MIPDRNIIRNNVEHTVPSSISGSGPPFEKRAIMKAIMIPKETIERRKNVPLKNNHNHFNAVIAFGFSSILSSLFAKYYFTGINFFGGSNKKQRRNTTDATPQK
jgi:hypothetical protein